MSVDVIAKILDEVKAGKIDIASAAAQLKAASEKQLKCKVSEKGALSLYGLQRMPVTLYAGQWERLFAYVETIKAFIAENRAALSAGRDDKRFAKVDSSASAPADKPAAQSTEDVAAALLAALSK